VDKAREVFQTALEFFGDEEDEVDKAQAVFGAFARMETRMKEYDRARVIYKVCWIYQSRFDRFLIQSIPYSSRWLDCRDQSPPIVGVRRSSKQCEY
jgi:hypothetical protein